MRRTIEIDDDVDYLVKAYRAKALLETGTEFSYNDALEILICNAIVFITNMSPAEVKKNKTVESIHKELKKRLVESTLSESLERFIKREE